MRKCIDSLLPGGDEVEILIVNDGSTKDRTAEIADEYEAKYPGICRAIHQENGGHGEAVNAGLRAATGIYFKVVDSDDWVNTEAYQEVMEVLRRFVYGDETLDMLVTNFVYEKQGAKHKRVMQYRTALPKRELMTWDDVKVFILGQYILMHSVVYRTEMLRDCGLELPKHTFYVDNIFVYYPLSFVKTMFYLNTDFYRYFIGREDQSVNESIMIKRIDQQLFVTKTMIEFGSPLKDQKQNKKLCQYQLHYLAMMMTICTILLKIANTQESKSKIKQLWAYLKDYDQKLYQQLRWKSLATLVCLPRFIAVPGYKIARKIYKFN